MKVSSVTFDQIRAQVAEALSSNGIPAEAPPVYLIRDLFGRVGISVSEAGESDALLRDALDRLAVSLEQRLGAHARRVEGAVVWAAPEQLAELEPVSRRINGGVRWVDLQVVGGAWSSVSGASTTQGLERYALYSVKGGMGRSTTAAVLARHLAAQGRDVLVADLDLGSPGLASAVLEDDVQPAFGVVDWFVEGLVGQGDVVVDDMAATPKWSRELPGQVWIAPAHGRRPGEYLAKLGRAYLDTRRRPWLDRFRRLLESLESRHNPSVVIVESRSGLNDVAASTVTDLNAQVLLFGVDSSSTWDGYRILFDHWRRQGLAPAIRDRLSTVSALTPEVDTEDYVDGFRERAWDLFRESLYDRQPDDGGDGNEVSYGLLAEEAPHNPMVIKWNRGLGAGASLRALEESAVRLAYTGFLKRFDGMRAGTVPKGEQKIELAANTTIGLDFKVGLNVVPSSETIRSALADLPAETAHGKLPRVQDVYLPPSHRKALHPDVSLVTGMRGSGKTFWWSALGAAEHRELVARLDPRLQLLARAEVSAGFGVTEAPDRYPGRDELRAVLTDGVVPRLIWRTVHAFHVADGDHPIKARSTWRERAQYVVEHPDAVARLLRSRHDDLDRRGVHSLLLFDGLDRSADDWPTMFGLVRGLLEHALDVRSYRRLRVKVFLRTDQADESRVANFPDASKILASAMELSWPRRDLYGLLWQHLANGSQGESMRPWLARGDWPAGEIAGREVFLVPSHLARDEEEQRDKFHEMTGPWMGTDRRRGFPYTWVPSHLADADGRVSPRSFIAALRKAAEDAGERYQQHGCALHYESTKRGVQAASKIRVSELREDYPWVHDLLGALREQVVVPCDFDLIGRIWRDDGVVDRIAGQTGEEAVRLPPQNLERGEAGVREDLESLGILRRLTDGRVDLPDVYRVGYGIGRRGGVKTVR